MISEHETVIVGGGFSGIGMAIKLCLAGLRDFLVLEKGEDVGGVWRDHTYPGCGADVPATFYSFSLTPHHPWSSTYPPQEEIWAYLRQCVRDFGIKEHIAYRREMLTAAFDKDTQRWTIHTAHGQYRTRFLILATGGLSKPLMPNLDSFTGTAFHTSQWDHTCELQGKRVAVIGTGASAIQVVPHIAIQAAQLNVFQRTPAWILPRLQRTHRLWEQRLTRRLPGLQRLRRAAAYWSLEVRGPVMYALPRLGRLAEAVARRHLHRHVHAPDVRKALTPLYRIGCKRILLSSDFLPALRQPHVRAVSEPISEIRGHEIVTQDGTRHPTDVIICATGYDVIDEYARLDITGTHGRNLAQVWSTGLSSYLGVNVAGFPNMFLLLGPYSAAGHTSVLFMAEAQMHYILRCLRLLDRTGARSLDVRADAQQRFEDDIQRRSRRSVWTTGGCDSWYLDRTGTNRVMWPKSTVAYWLRTRSPRRGHYHLHQEN
ncbi:NAD(P)/FAD-dependent oxidoreductase [Streptomyces sp. SID13666]|uniref:flavin-containing monooxygenase n=1 Tax=unclassified Streptomyces TaxID=2593676 RepID=UPI0013C0F6F7|nr:MULTISPECIES: NAD(P)/FAD-dependent oxidoreductase [unclassified Streptomyces]NEA54261.1 NAD(P)/FAD-dependent oxidoreductase [Streptomyces sp. SID13666]NEA70356.1 NAD(P)/FAD-dependent oxidoreductase [Streptomyces sp. SID13588]